MTNFIFTNLFLLCGLGAFCYGGYYMLRGRKNRKTFLWFLAGLVTVVGTTLDSTVVIYFARSGHERSMFYVHSIAWAFMLTTWLYVVYKEMEKESDKLS
jgi:hypothetical protein